MLVAVCFTDVSFYVVKSEEDSWDLSDVADNKVIFSDDKIGGFSHISCIQGLIFFVKEKTLIEVNLPVDPKKKTKKYSLTEKPILFEPSSKDKNA